jgi:hypothetical protein
MPKKIDAFFFLQSFLARASKVLSKYLLVDQLKYFDMVRECSRNGKTENDIRMALWETGRVEIVVWINLAQDNAVRATYCYELVVMQCQRKCRRLVL